MRRRRDTAPTVTFDLVPDDGPLEAVDAAAPGEVPPSAVGRLVRAVRAWPRRRKIVVVATVLGLALAATGITVTVDVLRDRALRAQVVAAPGGIASLAEPPRERWRTELSNPQPVALMDGMLVVAERDAWDVVEDDTSVTLTALDPGDGAVRWSTKVEGALQCGRVPATGMSWIAGVGEATEVVCPTGGTGDGVAVVGADGSVVARRALDGHTGTEMVLAVSEALVRYDRAGPPATGGLVDGALSEAFTARDLVVRLEDAVTGDVRWETTVPGATAPAGATQDQVGQCLEWDDAGPGDDVSDRTPGYGWDISVRWLWISACGISASLDLATGEIVRSVNPFEPGAYGWDDRVVALETGDYATRSDEVGSGESYHVWRQDGTVAGDIPGGPVLPTATDGSRADVLLAIGLHGLAAYDPADLSELWTRPSAAAWPYARTEHVLVTQDGTAVMGLDPRTGQTLWESDAFDARPDASGHPEQVYQAFTDGRLVVLMTLLNGGIVNDDGTADVRMRALDLATGTPLWTAERTAPLMQPIGGRLYEFATDAVVGLG